MMPPVCGSLPSCVRLIDLVDSGLLANTEFELAHIDDGDAPYATVCGMSAESLSDDARRDWADVLSAKVSISHPYLDTLWIDLDLPSDECSMDRVKDFVLAYAGYCSVSDSNRWFPQSILRGRIMNHASSGSHFCVFHIPVQEPEEDTAAEFNTPLLCETTFTIIRKTERSHSTVARPFLTLRSEYVNRIL